MISENDAFGNVSPVRYADISFANEPVAPDSESFPPDALTAAGQPLGFRTQLGAFDYEQIDGLFNLQWSRAASTT